MAFLRVQSAMEYLMTYGWAILIIAVVLGALFGLGFFNSANLAVKASPGSCQVYRPNGPGTTTFINLEGTCNDELPQYVAQFNGASGSGINMPSGTYFTNGQFSISGWVYLKSYNSWMRLLDFGNGPGSNNILFAVSQGTTGEPLLQIYGNSCWGPEPATSVLPLNTWVFLEGEYTGGSIILYENGAQIASFGSGGCQPLAVLRTIDYIGRSDWSGDGYFNGLISNVQVYNTSLSANEVTALYDEGIGGNPIEINNLVGWWPLNGNANDYSGDLNNGVPTGVVYTSSWTAGYSAP